MAPIILQSSGLEKRKREKKAKQERDEGALTGGLA